MREASFIIFKDEDGLCVVAKVTNFERFHTPTGVAIEVKKSRRYRKTNIRFINGKNAFTKKEIQEAAKILEAAY